MKTIIVIPAYNEEHVVGEIVSTVMKLYSDVIVVDDASYDATASVALKEDAEVIQHLINRGQGAALQTGIRRAIDRGADIVVTFDADGQHDENDIEKLITPIHEGTHDVVLGSRFLHNKSDIPILRKIVLKLAVIFTQFISNIHVTDTHNGLRAFSRNAASKINITQDRWDHASQILEEISQKKLVYTEVPVTIRYTEYSRRKGQPNTAMFKIALKFILSKLK